MSASYGTIEVVRGRLDDERADRLVQFWARAGVLDESAGRRRLDQVVCVVAGPDGEIRGANSVFPAELGLIGGRRFWVYRNYLTGPARAAQQAMARMAFLALQGEFDPAAEGPIGVCFMVDDRAVMERNPGAEWLYPACLYAGYDEHGRQVRIRYFEGARIGRPREVTDFPMTLDHSYRTTPFADQDEVGAEAVVGFWTREGATGEEEARRRAGEVVVVSTHGDGELVAVGTAYLEHNAQLEMDMWYFRAFVAAEHRESRVAWSLALVARDHLQQRYVGGVDTRAQGIVFEVENEALKEHMDYGLWPSTDFTFIGENERGDHVRVHYFPGARAPVAAE